MDTPARPRGNPSVSLWGYNPKGLFLGVSREGMVYNKRALGTLGLLSMTPEIEYVVMPILWRVKLSADNNLGGGSP